MCACLPSPELVWNWYMYMPQVVESTYRNVVPIIYQLSASSWRSFVCACMQDAESICLLLYSETDGKTSNDSKLRAYCLREAIQWKFNLEASPWWGSFFERLVSYTLIQIEGVLNSRSLHRVCLWWTYSQLMIGRRILSTPLAAPRTREPETLD